jgi:protein-arginine kinase activator protein McsA
MRCYECKNNASVKMVYITDIYNHSDVFVYIYLCKKCFKNKWKKMIKQYEFDEDKLFCVDKRRD